MCHGWQGLLGVVDKLHGGFEMNNGKGAQPPFPAAYADIFVAAQDQLCHCIALLSPSGYSLASFVEGCRSSAKRLLRVVSHAGSVIGSAARFGSGVTEVRRSCMRWVELDLWVRAVGGLA